ncbi:MAG: adenylyltransferase/cytidyltransferase family protein [Nanoarchaeota archaeon]
MTIVTYNDLVNLREKYKESKIIFCSGSFDLLHAGHILFFEDCKKYGDVLVVGVGDDQTLRSYKGEKRPILNEHVRIKMVDSLKCVDYCFIDCPSNVGEKIFFSPLSYIFQRLRPDFYAVNEDGFRVSDTKEVAEKFQVKVLLLKRECPVEFDNVSTSKIIERIKRL